MTTSRRAPRRSGCNSSTPAPRDGTPGRHWLLIRRSIRTGELAYYRAHAPARVKFAALARVAGRRWTVLAMLAYAFLAVTAATQPDPVDDDSLIPLTLNEMRRLFTTLIGGIRDAATAISHRLHWSRWRRRHQARARTCHYRRQQAQLA